MDQPNDSKPSGLEDQLRGMILGNVRIGHDQPNQDTHHSQRGRGRGRGGFSRGGYRNYPNRPEQTHVQSDDPNAPSPATFRHGGRANFHHGGPRPQHAQNSTHNQHGLKVPPGLTADGVESKGSKSPRQPYSRPAQTVDHIKPHGRGAPRILERPQNSNVRPNQGPGVSNSAQNQRPQVPYHQRPHFNQPRENPVAQTEYLDALALHEIPKAEMSFAEFQEKDNFRKQLEFIMQKGFAENYSGDITNISLVGFGSLESGFGMPGSDMDLAVVPGWKDPSKVHETEIDREVPRLLERAVLDAKMGGRLLTRTRVPILKVCQYPTEELYSALFDERKKWDELPVEEKYPVDLPPEPSPLPKPPVDTSGPKPEDFTNNADSPGFDDAFPKIGAPPVKKTPTSKAPTKPVDAEVAAPAPAVAPEPDNTEKSSTANKEAQPRTEKQWLREKVLGPLDFPKTGLGIQCDINFGNALGIHNTHLLRCYSLTDPRVRPIVLFVKSWAKRRKVNSSYSGTLSSYGWVLMVLHYLVNVARPPVCPNLQHSIPQPKDIDQLENFFKDPVINGYTVRFWRNEQEIVHAAQLGHLSQNQQTVGALLRGFFQYYASLSAYGNHGPRPPQFYWTNEVLSLRTPGGIRTKQDKGWVSAKTTITAEKKVTNRYLFAIEDPFELDHNVARTVTHKGIVAIRDEFRRAWRILVAIGKGAEPEGGIFDEIVEEPLPPPMAKEGEKGENKVEEQDKVKATDAVDTLPQGAVQPEEHKPVKTEVAQPTV